MLTYDTPPKGGGLYLIRLSDTHYYGGRAKHFKVRWRRHLTALQKGSHTNAYMQSVFNKYERFDPEILRPIPSLEGMIEAERTWLDQHFGQPGCLNLSRCPTNNTHLSPEARAKISATNTGRKQHPDAIRRSAESRRGLKQSEEHRRKNSLGHMGITLSEETRRKMSQNSARKGKSINDALRAGIVASNKLRAGETRSPEVRERISKTLSLKVWVCNAVGATTRIPPGDLPEFQAEGWQRGRKYRAIL